LLNTSLGLFHVGGPAERRDCWEWRWTHRNRDQLSQTEGPDDFTSWDWEHPFPVLTKVDGKLKPVVFNSEPIFPWSLKVPSGIKK